VTTEQAKRTLLLYRPDLPDDAEFSEALAEARRDPELARWLEQHLATQRALRQKFRQISVPAELKEQIVTGRVILRPAWWQKPPIWIGLAAAIVLYLGLTVFKERRPDQFADYRISMVETVLREYRMEITSNDDQAVRQHLQTKGAPANYTVPNGLQKVPLKGGGRLRWRGHPVAMVCFERKDKELLYLFVLDQTAFKDPPRATPELAQVNQLMTASWSSGNRTYVLAGPEDAQSIRKYL
jgi:uncharacterized membrane protein YbaN (DUF454 family)